MPTFSFERRLDHACRVVIPHDLRALYDLQTGDTICLTAVENGVLITRQPPQHDKKTP